MSPIEEFFSAHWPEGLRFQHGQLCAKRAARNGMAESAASMQPG